MGRIKSFFVDELPDSETVVISGSQAHHLSNVLRLEPGARVMVYDASGSARYAEIARVTRKEAELRLLDEALRAPVPSIEINVYPSVVRPAAMEKMIVMCSELGAAAITPLITKRSRSRLPGLEKQKRWRRLAVESSKQCERTTVMEVREPSTFEDLDLVGLEGLKIILHRGPGRASLGDAGPDQGRVHLLVGPEGGWEPSELRLALHGGFEPIDLGPRILRSETACVASVVMVQAVLGDLRNVGR